MVRKPSLLKRMLPAFGVALIAALAFSAIGAGSASATSYQWYSCKEVASGTHTDSACQTEGAGKYEWSKLGAAPTYFGMGGENFILKGTVSLVKMTYTCSAAEAIGELANPESGSGTLSTEGWVFQLNGCTAVTGGGAKCEIVGGSIPFKALSGTATQYEGKLAVKIGETGVELAEFTTKCPNWSAAVKVTGYLYAVVNPATSSLEITEASSSGLKTNGAKGTLAGTAEMVTWIGEEGLKLGPVDAPENTALPSISPANPSVGSKATATSGSWTNEPDSYGYQWNLCNASGSECNPIFGATGSSYTPNSSDEGHALTVQVTATNADGSKSATSTATGPVRASSSGTRHWYVCEEVAPGTGGYEDADCGDEAGKGDYEWVQLPAGSATAFSANNTMPIKFSWTIALTKYTVECSTESGTGTVLNPTGGGAGTLSGSSTLLTFSGCEFLTPSGCTVTGGTIGSYPVSSAIEGETIKLTGSEGANLWQFERAGCGSATYTITGTLRGILYSATTSVLDFPSSIGQTELKANGTSVSFEGAIQLETTSGGPLRYKA